MKYSISTKTLYFISASSEKYSANLETLLRYLPSIGEMAFSCVIFYLIPFLMFLFDLTIFTL